MGSAIFFFGFAHLKGKEEGNKGCEENECLGGGGIWCCFAFASGFFVIICAKCCRIIFHACVISNATAQFCANAVFGDWGFAGASFVGFAGLPVEFSVICFNTGRSSCTSLCSCSHVLKGANGVC